MSNLAYYLTLDKREPFHYKEMYNQLTHKSKVIGNYSSGTRHFENFRNRLDYDDPRFTKLNNGFFTLTQWVKPQTLLENYDPISTPTTLEQYSKAAIEAGNRVPHMKNKYHDPPKQRLQKVLRGYVNEFGVSSYYEQKYPENFITPKHQYDEPYDWDFALFFPQLHKHIRIDVKSKDYFRGMEVLKFEKWRINRNWADIYLCADSNGSTKHYGYALQSDINKAIKTNTHYIFPLGKLHDCKFLETYLNHLTHGFNEERILQNGHPWRVYSAESN